MSKHSPTPWSIEKCDDGITYAIRSATGVVAMDAPDDQDPPIVEDAEFIVRAVNAHDALVEAIVVAEDALRGIVDAHHDIQWIRNKLQAALKLARSER
jgi:hypothetical protein